MTTGIRNASRLGRGLGKGDRSLSSIISIKRSRGVKSGEEGVITDAYVHATIHRNSLYRNMVKKSIYNTRCLKHPHLTILWSKTTPRGPHFLAWLHGTIP